MEPWERQAWRQWGHLRPGFPSMARLGAWVWGPGPPHETGLSLLHYPTRGWGVGPGLCVAFPSRCAVPAHAHTALSSSPLPHAACRARVTTKTRVTMGMTQIKCKCHGELCHPLVTTHFSLLDPSLSSAALSDFL